MKKIIEKGRLLSAKARCFAQNFGQDESGMGTVEVVLIIVEKPNAKHRYVLCGN